MFHLFNSVYVETERRVAEGHAHINLSTNTGFEYHYDEKTPYLGEQLGFATSIDELTPERFQELMEKAFQYEEKVFIYCDSASYIRLYAILIRALFPKIDFETYKYFFLCFKSMYEIARIRYTVVESSIKDGVYLEYEDVRQSYFSEDPYVAAMREVIAGREQHLSLEWRLIKLRLEGKVSTIPDVLNNLIRRSIIGYGQQAHEEWSHYITDPSIWDEAGTNLYMLLSSETTAAGCPVLGYLSHPLFNTAQAFSSTVSKEWLHDVILKCAEVFGILERNTHVARTTSLARFVEADYVIDTPEKCMDVIDTFFGHRRFSSQIAGQDVVKYNHSVVRHILKADPADLAKLIEDVVW